MVKTHKYRLGLGHGTALARHAVVHVHALGPNLSSDARHLQGVPKLDGAQVVDGVVRNQHANLRPIPSTPTHSLPPPVNPRLLHVDQIFGIVHDAVRVHV